MSRRRIAAGWAGVVIAAGCLWAPAPCAAVPATAAQVADLAQRAQSDPAAMSALLTVTEVDGQPVDMPAALAGGDDQRLAELARSASAAASGPSRPSADEARAHAAQILGPSESRPSETGDGSDGGLELPTLGLPAPLLIALAVAVVVAAGFGSRAIARRRVVEAAEATARRAPGASGPRGLDTAAREAERRGDYAAAVRLRFEAGVARLAALDRLGLSAPLTAARAGRALQSPSFAALADEYERIAFGGRQAAVEDADRAREGWQRVLGEVGA